MQDPFHDLEKSKVCYDYLYLDDCEALNALSAAARGIKGDSTIEVTTQRGGSTGLKFSLWGVGFDLSANGSRGQRKQFINRETIHSQMRSLFAATESSVAKVGDAGQVQWLREGYLVRFDGYIEPLSDTPQTAAEHKSRFQLWIQAKFSWLNMERKERERRRAMIGSDTFVGLAHIFNTSARLNSEVIALELNADYVMVARKEDFARRATVFGWVTCVPYENLHGLSAETTAGRTQIIVRYKDQRALGTSRTDGDEAETEGGDGDSHLALARQSVPVQTFVMAPPPRPVILVASGAANERAPAKAQATAKPHGSGTVEVVPSNDRTIQAGNGAQAASTSSTDQIDSSFGEASPPQEPVKLAALVRPICIYH
jgi:hypothetical protein